MRGARIDDDRAVSDSWNGGGGAAVLFGSSSCSLIRSAGGALGGENRDIPRPIEFKARHTAAYRISS